MGHSRVPKQRLPDHLKRLSGGSATAAGRPAPSTERPSGRPGERPSQRPATEPPAPGGPDRLTELLPLVLRAMVVGGGGAGNAGPTGGAPRVVGQADILTALAPYHRPRSRFEGLMIRKLVGEGYLRPRGARDKHGLSAAYALTPKAEQLLAGHGAR